MTLTRLKAKGSAFYANACCVHLTVTFFFFWSVDGAIFFLGRIAKADVIVILKLFDLLLLLLKKLESMLSGMDVLGRGYFPPR